MSMTFDADVDVCYSECGKDINHEDDIICKTCYEGHGEVNEILEAVRPYVSEATLNKDVVIPAEVAVMLKNKIRGLK